MTYELKPFHTNQKSFYRKAMVTVTYYDDCMYLVLQSYDTNVAMVKISKGGMPHVQKLWGGYSATTMRHVNELLAQEGIPKLSARVWRYMKVGNFYTADDVTAIEKNLK